MQIDAAGFSARGVGRKINGDAFIVDQTVGFFAVADTVGTFTGDTIPSYLVIQYVRDALLDKAECGDAVWQHILKQAILGSNEMLLRNHGTTPGRNRGTTLTCCLIRGAQAWFAHLGDGRAYLVHGAQIIQMTKDETLAALLYERNMITSSAALKHPGRNQVLNALGFEPEIRVTTWATNLTEASKIVMCTDGVAAVLPGEAILKIATKRKQSGALAKSLVDSARRQGSRDDATALVIGTLPD